MKRPRAWFMNGTILLSLAIATGTACEKHVGETDHSSPQAATGTTGEPKPVRPIFVNTADVIEFYPPSAKLRDRLASFKVTEVEAYQTALREFRRRLSLGLAVEAMDNQPLATTGRRYVFGKPYKAKRVLRGYYVDGDSGEVEWRDAP